LGTPRYYELLEKISDKTTVGVILIKVLIGMFIYGPIANG
jgi:hypothetical protein